MKGHPVYPKYAALVDLKGNRLGPWVPLPLGTSIELETKPPDKLDIHFHCDAEIWFKITNPQRTVGIGLYDLNNRLLLVYAIPKDPLKATRVGDKVKLASRFTVLQAIDHGLPDS
jgi:hypothetical protein